MSDNKSRFPWPRYWLQDGSNDYETFIQSGYLALPSSKYSHFYSNSPKQLADLAQIPVLILLGEPGYGKSQSLADEYRRLEVQQADDLLTFCDLKTYGPGDQQSLKDKLLDEEKLKLVEQGKRLWILLDGLDECGLHAPEDWLIRELAHKIHHPEHVFIRITCRASHRPQLLEEAFSKSWRSVHVSPVELWRLCPLRKEDIRIAAQASQIIAEDFLRAIADRNVEALAALPVTLKFMLRLFREKQLPKKRTEIFEQGLNLLCEDSPKRRNSADKSQTAANVRFEVAARIALGYIFQGCNGVWHGPNVECPHGLFNAKDITSKKTDYEINEQAVSETLELTGIFARLDSQRFQFASRTFAEFLAAWYMAKSKVPIKQKLKVLLHPESQRLIPDLHETAAWLGALDSEFLVWLINKEPEAALEADFAVLSQSDLPTLVDSLLDLTAKELQLRHDSQQLAKLKYPGLETKLSDVITDSSSPYASRALAIKIAIACELQDLGDDLADLVLNEHEVISLRELAASAMSKMDDDTKVRLIPIAESSSNSPLKAIVLSVIGPRLMGAEAFFNQISPTSLESDLSELSYQIYEEKFLNELSANGLTIGLRWIAKHAPIGHDRLAANRLKSRLLAKAFDFLQEEVVAEALVKAMVALQDHYEHFFDGLKHHDQPQNFFDNTSNRRIVLIGLLKQINANAVWKFFNNDCFREEDGAWLFQQFDRSTSETERRVIAEAIHQLIKRYSNLDIFEEVLNRAGCEVTDPDPILAEHMASLINPVDLTSEETISYRKLYLENQALIREHNQARQKQVPSKPPEFYIQTHLLACESGEFNRWSDLAVSLTIQDNDSWGFPSEPDSLPGWQNADDKLRNRIAEVAINYLESAVPPSDEVLMQNSRTSVQAAGGLAVIILTITNNLQRLSKECLSRWCFAIVAHFFDQNETQEQIFREVRSIVPTAFDEAALKKIDHDVKTRNFNLLQSCREFWHPSFLKQLADARLDAPDWSFDNRLRLAELLISSNVGNIKEQLVDWLTTESDLNNRCAVAKTLFLHVHAQDWPVIQKLLTDDTEFAHQIILAVADQDWRGQSVYPKLDVEQLGWLYDRIRILFPPAEDPLIPSWVFTPTPRFNTAQFRDDIIGRLVALGTPESVKELDRICVAYSDSPWLIRARADAYKNLWRQERNGLSFNEAIKLLSDAQTSVVRTSQELMIAVEEALQNFAHESQHGSPPLAIFLWNEGQKKPFSEQRLSDFLKFYLAREWRGRRIIINREVEIRNIRPFGIGERTDLLIQAVAPDSDNQQPHPCVVVEVKPDKTADPKKDIPEQLVQQYLDGVSRTCGIYLVGWFGQSRRNIEDLREDATRVAVNNTTDRIYINSLVLDLSHPLK